jgi:hypothetical protein
LEIDSNRALLSILDHGVGLHRPLSVTDFQRLKNIAESVSGWFDFKDRPYGRGLWVMANVPILTPRPK